MKTLCNLLVVGTVAIFVVGLARGSTVIVSDTYTAATSGSGFALNTGINRGINPPTTRLTGSTAANLRYMNTGTKVTTAYTITSNKAQVDPVANPGRFVLSANGTTSFDYGPALGTTLATPATPIVYDISISIKNASSDNQRCSFALGTAETDANSWDFGFQIYRTNSTMTKYFIGKRIDTDASGLAADLNSSIILMAANTFGTEITVLMRVTDAGAETTAFHSRVQLSLDAGATWFYDTATDTDLPNGFRFNATSRHLMWDQAPGAGPITYDNFTLTWKSGPRAWTGGGSTGNWSDAANWAGAVPGNGDFLTFAGATRTTNTNDLSSLSVPWLKFNAGGFSVYGNAFTVIGALTNSSGNNTINAAITSGGTLQLQSDAGTLTLSGAVANGGQTLTADGAGNTTISAVVSGTGALTKNGSGTLQLSGASANTYSGVTTVNSGTLLLAKTAGVAAVPGNITIGDGVGGANADVVRLSAAVQISSSAVTISASGLLDLNGFNETIGSVTGSAGGAINLGAGTLTVGDATSTTYAGTISGTGSLTKTGSGTLTLSGASTYTGATTVSTGVLNVQNATALGTAGTVSVASGSALELQGGITTSAQPLTINGTGISGNGALRNISGNNTWSGSVSLGSASTVQSDSGTLTIGGGVSGGQPLTVDGAGNTTFSGAISGSGSLTKNDAGTLTLNAANTYTGNTTINSGAVTIGSGGSIASSPVVTIATGATLNTSSSFAIASSQTLARNATSGSASINGPITFNSGANLSLPADGTADTVSSVSVTGNLTLNNNVITVNVSGSTLNSGSYTLLTYTGTRSGTFNSTPIITGSGLQSGKRALVFITGNTVYLKVIAIETDSVFRVMTYNIHSGADPVTGNIDTTRAANFINTNNIDLVSLNEVARNMPRSNGRDIIAELSQKTGLPFVFSNNMAGLPAGQSFGNAILSRFPILNRDHRLLPNINGNEQRGWLKATVDVNGKYINFESTHLDFHQDSTERLMCVTNINLWLLDEVVPTIIAGDFNDTPDTPFYNRMDTEWNDIWLTAGDGSLGRSVPSPGYPNNLNARIDYIWKASGTSIKPTNAFVGYTLEASDHYPVITDFILTSTTDHEDGFYFPFNEGSGSTVTDSIGGLVSTSGTPTWSTSSPSGQSGDSSLSFNGSKIITVPDPKQIIGQNPFNADYTLQTWVKLPLNYAPAARAIMFQYTRDPGFSFSINTNRTLHTTTFKIKDISSTATVPNDAAWHHVAVVHTDGVNMKFYIDGALSATVTYTNGAGYRVGSEINIGADPAGANWFTGNLDRIRFDNRALTPAELDYTAGSPRPLSLNALATWKSRYGITDMNADNDADGQSNNSEYLAGTDPTDATSKFQILDAKPQPDGRLTVTWSSIGGKRYRIQVAETATGPFTDIERDAAAETDPSPAGQPSTQSFTETEVPTAAPRFYRIEVIP